MVKKFTVIDFIIRVLVIIIAVLVLFPFFLIVINVFRNANDIVSNPVSVAGMSVEKLMKNLTAVINNTNFSFWSAFATSAIVTVFSLVLLALFGGMAAWVICRNKTKWSAFIYMVFSGSYASTYINL